MSDLNFTIWFTGKPFSGKKTSAQATAMELENRGFKVEVIDEEAFWKEKGNENPPLEQLQDAEYGFAYTARILNRRGFVAIVSAVSPKAETRETARKLVGNFVEVQCRAPEEFLENRRQELGAEKSELSEEYEAPENPALVLKTDVTDPDLCAQAVMVKLEEMGYVETDPDEYSDDERSEIDERLKSLGYM